MAVTLDPLTERETEIVLMLADGNRQYHIAAVLGISVDTLKRHIYNIGKKLYTNSAIEIVSWYYKTYWRPLNDNRN